MKPTLRTILFAGLGGLATVAHADCVTGVINTVNPWKTGGAVFVQMTDRATLQGSCPAPSTWFSELFSDNTFRQFLYPVILIAKVNGDVVTICASGCIASTYPEIDSVEYSPRLP